MASKTCSRRLQKELIDLKKSPVENIVAAPNEKNILEWHYVVSGPKGTVYEGGLYHGMLKFPPEYPYKPPSIIMITNNGRFKTNTRLCLSISDYHPESWNPMWSVSSILQGLLSFMVDTTSTLGSLDTDDKKKRKYASTSLEENLKNPTFCQLFPEKVEEIKEILKDRAELEKTRQLSGVNSSTQNSSEQIGGKSTTNKQEDLSCFTVTAVLLVACAAIVVSFMSV